tara:strand:- start:26950 stop:27648 length:699 start_codon:yes stop_codon:yes gene_type:complete
MEKNEQLKDIDVKIIDSKTAKRYTIENHYMKTFPIPKVCFGVFYNNLLRGVITFGLSPSTEQKVKKIVPKIKNEEFIEMQRMNLSDVLGHNSESFVLGKIYKLFKSNTKIKLLITHAGGCKNDCGIVYQSSSWLYFGKDVCDDFYYTKKGEYKNIISPMRFGRVPKEVSKEGSQKIGEYLFGEGEIINSFRYLYIYPLNKGLRSYLEKSCIEYPKDSRVFRKDQEWINGGDQ